VSSGDEVRLRPVAEADLESLQRMYADPESVGIYNWGGWQNPRVWRRRWEEDGLIAGDRNVLIISNAADEFLGSISWRPVEPRTPYQRWEIGISLFPQHRGKGYGTVAQRLLVRYLFETTPAYRIQALTDADNIAEQRSLEKAGFTLEGRLRGHAFRSGSYRDEFLYAIIRPDAHLS
jgi:RimJ/RimL family protein N-acetyltransferase